MLTFTMARVANSIHVLFFIDHQSPVVLHNQWDHELGFRIVSSPSFPEAVGAQHYMEYDWRLQSRRNQSLRKGEGDENGSASTLKDWLTLSNIEAAYNASNTDVSETVRFQIGSPTCGWSNTLWQVGGIQFATFSISDDSEELPRVPSFLVMCSQRAGTWYISITCLEDPLRSSTTGATENLSTRATFAVSSMQRQRPRSLNICFSIAELRFHCCDEFDPVRDGRGLIQYPEIFRLSCSSSTVVFSTSADPPESARYSDRLGYLSHVRAYSTLLISIENMELDHFLQDCNFPVILSFPGNEERHAKREIMELELASKHTALQRVVSNLLEKQMPLAQANCLVGRIIFVDTWDRDTIPAFFHSIEVRTLPAVLQPLLDAITGAKVTATALTLSRDQASDTASGTKKNSSSRTHQSLSAMSVTRQRKLFIELLEIGDVEVTVTARVSIPILNSFDGTPVRFGTTQMRNVFAFPDQLYKDLAADYVADAIVRSPMLLMSLNIIGNPAGFFRNVGTGVRDLFEIPLAAAKDGYNPWILTKGVVGGVSSFFGHTTAAALTSLSGFSYSISRTMEQLTLPSEQLKKRHYARPTHLSSALADGLGSLGSSVVGAATGVITTPMAIYKERQQQGLETKFGDVVGGVGMGLVGIVARPMGGVASLVSIASDGILYGSGMGDSRHLLPFDDMQLASRFDARPNEVLRYKLKVLSDVVGDVVYAHGVWVAPSEKLLAVEESGLHYLPERLSIELSTSKKESSNVEMDNAVQKLLLADDHKSPLVPVTVLASNQYLYIIGECGSSKQVVIAKTPLIEVNAVEENLTEPSKLDFGIWRSSSIQWLRFRLVPSQRRQLSHQVRLWMVETQF
uniref:Uncharacterized protein n=1 Tax=Globisporangium ultimum (strain ATCC 200006 / CBS 805.95 / DAOM BR144) TaxID=431595 RepID=K3X2H3_GLOUD